ncbi:hypothetical protein [Rubritalea tangerina]|uniref:hypothetical protein n=1 Tax=Rubritalea tangerina TaxID=430798 RepID=UPI00360DDB87
MWIICFTVRTGSKRDERPPSYVGKFRALGLIGYLVALAMESSRACGAPQLPLS